MPNDDLLVSERTYRRWLDASLVPLEKALLSRADVLARDTNTKDKALRALLSEEFRSLAKELHAV